jgi:head-tail adaptor
MRIAWGSRYLDIIALINMDERNRELEIIAEELTV